MGSIFHLLFRYTTRAVYCVKSHFAAVSKFLKHKTLYAKYASVLGSFLASSSGSLSSSLDGSGLYRIYFSVFIACVEFSVVFVTTNVPIRDVYAL